MAQLCFWMRMELRLLFLLSNKRDKNQQSHNPETFICNKKWKKLRGGGGGEGGGERERKRKMERERW